MSTKTKKTIAAAIQAEISKRNKSFTKANMQRRRILIAKDIIAQINAEKLVAYTGDWYETIDSNHEDFQVSFLSGKGEQCSCCALGAVMVSCALFKNSVKTADANVELDPIEAIYDKTRDKFNIKKIFGMQQLILIEAAFERGEGYFCSRDAARAGINDARYERALNFAETYAERNQDEGQDIYPFAIMIAIMQNIINNKGTFIP